MPWNDTGCATSPNSDKYLKTWSTNNTNRPITENNTHQPHMSVCTYLYIHIYIHDVGGVVLLGIVVFCCGDLLDVWVGRFAVLLPPSSSLSVDARIRQLHRALRTPKVVPHPTKQNNHNTTTRHNNITTTSQQYLSKNKTSTTSTTYTNTLACS